jgi:phosphohistidine phosphatase SixA
MKLFHVVAALALALLAACAGTPESRAPGAIFVMRHLQKAEGPDPALSAEGRLQAERLANWFGDDAPHAIYVSTTRRARETAAPLAQSLRLAPKEYDPGNTPALLEQLRREQGTVLVVGHSNTVPDIVEGLGGERPAPIAESQYGDIWRLWGTPLQTEQMSLGVP